MKKMLLLALGLYSGATASAYWQQKVDTRIDVVLDDRQHVLRGWEQIRYSNQSPDTLRFLYLHLWPNGYKDDRTAFSEQQVAQGHTRFYFATDEQRGGIDSLKFTVGQEPVDYYHVQDQADIIRIDLPQPLAPGDSLELSTPFRVKLPIVFSRLGHRGQAYFISQWFPKPAVYDARGWHPMPYLNQGEFYSETGSYDVRITLPDNYTVMATGNCLDEPEQQRLDSLSRLPLPADTLYRHSWPASSPNLKTLRFTEDNVHDFAWFADKRWIVRTDLVTGNGSAGTTQLFAAFLPANSKHWSEATTYLRQTIAHYGQWVGPYPYRTMKAVDGDMSAGGGMEYPTVTVIDRGAAIMLKTVLIHEAGHNWFYGILGSNEREHAWMDEGLNSFYEQKTIRALKEKDPVNDKQSSMEDALYYQMPAMGEDQAIEQHSARFSEINYGADVYYKTALMLRWLEAYMGADTFETAMKAYYRQWQFRHPYPEDFRDVLEQHTSKPVAWFFDGALQTTRPVDFSLRKVKTGSDSLSISISNKSDFAAPVGIRVSGDSTLAEYWTPPFRGNYNLTISKPTQWRELRLSGNYADISYANDQYYRSGLCHRKRLSLGFPFGFNHATKEKIYLAPSFGVNNYDGFSLGLLLHNMGLPQKRFQYAISPQYSFGSKRMNGLGAVAYSWYPRQFFKEIRLQADAKTYSYDASSLNIGQALYTRYFKVAPSLELIFRERDPLSPVRRALLVRQYTIMEDQFRFSQDFSVDSLYRPSLQQQQNTYALLRYTHNNTRTFHPFSYMAEAQLGRNFIKLGLEAKLRIDYDVSRKSLYLRAFAGKFISTGNAAADPRYYLNTTYSGSNDYLYDGTYYGRSESGGFASRQVSVQEGGFKIPTLMYANQLGRSDDWLLALNLSTDLPLGKLPIRLYLDIGSFADARYRNPEENTMSYNAGLELHLFRNLLSVYAPLLLSEDYRNYLNQDFGNNKGGSALLRGLSFSLNIQHVNFMRLPEKTFRLLSL